MRCGEYGWSRITIWLCGVGNSERNGDWRRLRISTALQRSDKHRAGAGRLEDSSGDGGSGGPRARARGSRVEWQWRIGRQEMQDAERRSEMQDGRQSGRGEEEGE